MYSTNVNGQGAARSTPWASPSALVEAKDREPGMSGNGYSHDDSLMGLIKTHECWLRVGSVNVTSMRKREGEEVEMVARWRLDFSGVKMER